MSVFVVERFIVHIESEGWELRDVYKVLDDINIRRLERYKRAD